MTRAVDNLIEACIFLSGIGFESGGVAAAHAIHNGLTVLNETHPMLHGEKVAFGTLVQLVLEDAPQDEIGKVMKLCIELDLPICLEQLGVTDITEQKVMAVAAASCDMNDTMGNMPFAVTTSDVCEAIFKTNQMGRGLLQSISTT